MGIQEVFVLAHTIGLMARPSRQSSDRDISKIYYKLICTKLKRKLKKYILR